ncbi:MAG: pantetheine-phosphate adenylyltransferase [Candidatus Paraprevotella stercoravium]|jgi:pantetheine-phosphate adenylyltransferase|uniref:Phosphopantetheine adenylyltransferase n=2 Tax=Bacteroidales TaxID=171549 RepID=A0ABT7U6U6_9BACE|nr:pantetheine-phosphate adenylyltransferase [Candidatus Paraprevotella stercoravium]MDM8146247.1 pantetheine-phosphate adenylyltransferase [Bacteroides eggerthii]
MRTAIFPGSFDPYTKGHDSIARRGLQLFDRIIIGVGINEKKKGIMAVEKRIQALKNLYRNEPRISVEAYSDLTVDFAKRKQADFILRGVRSHKDFEYELAIADVNKRLSGIETVILFTEPDLACISSTIVRELMHFGRDITEFLPEGFSIEE